MQYTRLGRSGAMVSRSCLGTMNFGPVTPEDESLAILDAAFERGITFIDTADVYGGGPFGDDFGLSERILGRWIGRGGASRREQVFIGTKFRMPMGSGPNDSGISAVHIRHAVDASLRRLQTDYLDLYQPHYIDRTASIDEVWEAFEVLRTQGKVLYFGSSNFAAWNIAHYQACARERGMLGLVSEQSKYHLAQRLLELEVIPALQSLGMGLIVYSPLGDGLLAGAIAKADRTRATPFLEALTPAQRQQLQSYEDYAADQGLHPAELGLAWLLHRPGVTAPIIGPRTLAHLDSALHALEIELADAQLAALDALWPGPGAPAPEAYSWRP